MTLKKQIFWSFLGVAFLSMLVSALAQGWIDLRLAMDLYGQNLSTSTQIQANTIEGTINKFLLNNGHFAGTTSLQTFLAEPAGGRENPLSDPSLAEGLVRFTDETMESAVLFMILDSEDDMVYATGTKSDIQRAEAALQGQDLGTEQTIVEIQWEEERFNLAVITPIADRRGGALLGRLVTIYDNDFFLKNISMHQQFGASNAFLYCTTHQQLVTAKHPIATLEWLTLADGSERVYIDGQAELVRWQTVANIPWVVVNTMPISHVYIQTLSYLGMGAFMLGVSILLALFLSGQQSHRILHPLRQLLSGVEQFLLSGEREMPVLNLDKKTEIGYLADKFSAMADGIATAQQELRESNYLYDVILRSTYRFRIHIDLERNEVTSSDELVDRYLCASAQPSASQRVMEFLRASSVQEQDLPLPYLTEIVEGKVLIPREVVLCCRPHMDDQESWLQIFSVPITGGGTRASKVVLHFADITERKMEELRLLASAQRDLHSGLLNKTTFAQLTQKSLEGCPTDCTMFFLDLDNFKQINDVLGHTAGDAVLLEIATKLTSLFRSQDLLCRYGGDEFAVFVSGMSQSNATKKAAQLMNQLPIMREAPDGRQIRVSACIGICVGTGGVHASQKEMLQRADKAMYDAKQQGKNRYSIWKEES
ncbi:MAG: GGDEF domain-containing protein [Hungatella sp.]